MRDQVFGGVVHAIAGKDPAAALELSEKLGGSQQQQYLYSIFSSWVDKDPAAAATRAAGLNSREARSQAFQAISNTWAESDPQAAMAWARSLPKGQDQRNAVSAVVSSWARTDLPSALAAVNQLPEGPTGGRLWAAWVFTGRLRILVPRWIT